MNRKVRISHVIAYLILFYAVLGCLLPCHFKRDRMTAGNEAICGTVQVRLDQQVQQVFLAEGTYLRYLDLYVTSEDSAGETYRLFLYDEHNEQLLNRETAMPETALPGYLRIPIGVETEPGTAYVWQLKGTDTPMDLAFENTAGTGLTTFGNYYFLQDGKTQMQDGQNIVMRLVYTDRPAAWKVAAACGVLLLTAAALAAAVWAAGKKSSFLSRRIRVRWLAVAACGPVWYASALWLLYEIFVRNLFGGKAEDRIVYAAGIGIATIYFTWVLFGRRREKKLPPFLETVSEKGMDWLQSACFALVLMGTIHFMNAQFQVQQDLAYREVLFWGCLVLLTMGPAKAVLNRRGIAWLLLSGAGGLIWYLYRRSGGADAARLSQIGWEIGIGMAAGLAALSLADKVRSHRFVWRGLNRFYACALFGILLLLALFRNTRGWPIYLAAYFGVFYLFYIGWDHRDRLLRNFCSGVSLNFAFALVFALARRPFRAWVYSRYNFVFHTVTITAYYLTLVICALTIRLLIGLYRDRKGLIRMWGTLLLYGMAVSLLFFTLSRTGYLAVAVMTGILVPFTVLLCFRQGWGALFREILILALSVLLCVPVTYTGVRLLPALYNDPYIYPVEESAAAIHKDDPKDSSAYMSVSYFQYVMENKLFAQASWDEQAKDVLLCLRGTLHETPGLVLVAAADGAGMDSVAEFSNGRMEIFRRYIAAWNLTGHDSMGVELADGTVSVHAHNTYLQVIHDHGLPVGLYYLLFGAVSAVLLFGFAKRESVRNPYAPLPLAVFWGFAVAGLVEWLFHPCNPMGYSVMVMFAPLLYFGKKKTDKKVAEKDAKYKEGKKEN